MRLTQLAQILNGTLTGCDRPFQGVSIDSRAVQKNNCFFAIKGEFFDGHDFIADVVQKNVAVIIVDRSDVVSECCNGVFERSVNIRDDISKPTGMYSRRLLENIPLQQERTEAEKSDHNVVSFIIVKNTRQALIDLAHYYRKNTTIPVAAITGSCGKTTTRALLENILKQQGQVLASQKSFNNDIGLPLTLLQLKPTHDFVVLEIGTNHPGEIAQLTSLAKPTVATVTMVAPVHIEHFKTLDAIAHEKGAVFRGLSQDGVAVINLDDDYAPLWKNIADNRQVVTFSQNQNADVMAKNIHIAENGYATFTLFLPDKKTVIALPLLGEHNVTNALAASAMAYTMGALIDAIKKGLETATPEYGRLVEKKGFAGAVIIDDSYNANPASVKAAIQVLIKKSNHPILVLGDMAELGETTKAAHEEIGLFAKQAGIQKLFCYGKNSIYAARKFGDNAAHFNDDEKLIEALKKELTSNTAVLIKGSRMMKMERVVLGIIV